MSNTMSFYQRHILSTPERINTVEQTIELAAQPGFVHHSIVNGQHIAFLGEKPLSQEELHNKFIRTNKMVIPAAAQMVNPNSLRKKIKETELGSHLEMKTEEDGLFWGEPLEDTILIDVCGKLSETAYKDLHFHHCENHIAITMEHSALGGGTCQKGVFTSFYDNGVLKHDLAIFYISADEIRKADERLIAERNSEDRANTNCKSKIIEGVFEHYFNDPYLKDSSDDFTPDFDWDNLKGLFLIPTLFSDQRVVYYCLPNAKRLDHPDHELKAYPNNSLSNWLKAVDESLPEGYELVISGNDENFIYIEEWSAFFCKNAALEVIKDENLYQKEILATKFS